MSSIQMELPCAQTWPGSPSPGANSAIELLASVAGKTQSAAIHMLL
jgi:hypothetical protein